MTSLAVAIAGDRGLRGQVQEESAPPSVAGFPLKLLVLHKWLPYGDEVDL